MFERFLHWLIRWWYGPVGIIALILYIQANVIPIIKSYFETRKLGLEIAKLKRERADAEKANQQASSNIVKPTLDDIRRYDEKIREIDRKIQAEEASRPRQGISGPTGAFATLLIIAILVYLLSKDIPTL